MALITLNSIGNVVVNPTFVGATPTGDFIPNAQGNAFVYFKNTNASPVVATIVSNVPCDQGVIHTVNATIPATDEVVVPLIARYNNTNGQVAITYDDVNETAATGIVTFNGEVSDGDIVTIGTRVYEFDTTVNPGSIIAGRVRVDVSSDATAPAAVTALVAAITNDTSAVVTATDGDLDTVNLIAVDTYSGTAGNAIVFTKTGTNIAVTGAGTLTNGADTLTLAAFRNTR